MRSILALVLALLILAAEVPGFFTESPVCAAVDGRGQATVQGPTQSPAPAKSCCGTASCPMHAKGCSAPAGCPMAAAKATPAGAPAQAQARAAGGASETRLCAVACGREDARVLPGVHDPGTLNPTCASAAFLTPATPIQSAPGELPTRNLVPTVPPPRA